RQNGDDTPEARDLLSAAQECCEQLQGLRILLLRQINAHQRQVSNFTAVDTVDKDFLVVGSMLSPCCRTGQVTLCQPEMDPQAFAPGAKKRDSDRLIHLLHLAQRLFSAG